MSQTREQRIEVIERQLLRKSMPRVQVSLILLLTGLAGFLVSFSLLHFNLLQMWVRYPIAILMAYGVFLVLLRLWLWAQGREMKVELDPSLWDVIPPDEFSTGISLPSGAGQHLDGCGAGGSVIDSAADGIGFGLDFEEGLLLVVAIIALLGGLIASLYIIYIAPALLAEILVDGVLVAGLYRGVSHFEQRHWLRGAVRRTLLPALLAAMFFAIAGYAMQKAFPQAHSIGEVWRLIA